MSQLISHKLFACFLISSTVIVSATAHSSFGADVPRLVANSETSLPEGFSKKKQIKIKKVSIGGVSMGSKADHIKSKLGQPLRKTTPVFLGAPEQYDATWEYPGLKINVRANVDKESEYYIHGLSTTSSRYVTERGVRVGDSVSKVKRLYGVFSMQDSTGPAGRTVAFAEGKPYFYDSLSFKIGKTGKVEEISLEFNGDEC
jgi:hypothetical protein